MDRQNVVYSWNGIFLTVKSTDTCYNMHEQESPLFKISVMPFCFYKRPMLVPTFANQEKLEDFHF